MGHSIILCSFCKLFTVFSRYLQSISATYKINSIFFSICCGYQLLETNNTKIVLALVPVPLVFVVPVLMPKQSISATYIIISVYFSICCGQELLQTNNTEIVLALIPGTFRLCTFSFRGTFSFMYLWLIRLDLLGHVILFQWRLSFGHVTVRTHQYPLKGLLVPSPHCTARGSALYRCRFRPYDRIVVIVRMTIPSSHRTTMPSSCPYHQVIFFPMA